MNLNDILLDMRDILVYDILRSNPPPFPAVDMHVTFQVIKEKNGGMWVQSTQYPGLLASGDSYEELREALFDAMLTYFNVPRYHAKRMKDTLVMNLENGTQIQPPQPVFQIRLVGA